MKSDYLNSVVLAATQFKEYIEENKKTIDKTSKTILMQALKAAQSIIKSNRSYFSKEELRSLLGK